MEKIWWSQTELDLVASNHSSWAMASPASTTTEDPLAQGRGTVAAASQLGAPKPVASNPPSTQFTNGLLVASGAAFLTGIFGSLWYQGRLEKSRSLSMFVFVHLLGENEST
jgi:hypothetical protein